MPLHIRPLQPSDEPSLRRRFGPEARAPWLRLPPPHSLATLLTPRTGLNVLVAELPRQDAVGLIAIDEENGGTLLVGPLVMDEQLADLVGRAMLDAALAWAERHGLPRVQAKVCVDDSRAVAFFAQRGFERQPCRQQVLAIRPADAKAPEPVLEAFRFGPSPELLSSEYLQLYQGVGESLGWRERAHWTRPEVFEHLQKDGVHPFVARHEEALIGLAEIEAHGDGVGRLALFGVLPEWRGSEVEEAFLAHVVRHAWAVLRLERLEASALVDEEGDAVADYAGAGFTLDADLVLFEKTLGAVVEPAGPSVGP